TNRFGWLPSGEDRSAFLKRLFRMIFDAPLAACQEASAGQSGTDLHATTDGIDNGTVFDRPGDKRVAAAAFSETERRSGCDDRALPARCQRGGESPRLRFALRFSRWLPPLTPGQQFTWALFLVRTSRSTCYRPKLRAQRLWVRRSTC